MLNCSRFNNSFWRFQARIKGATHHGSSSKACNSTQFSLSGQRANLPQRSQQRAWIDESHDPEVWKILKNCFSTKHIQAQQTTIHYAALVHRSSMNRFARLSRTQVFFDSEANKHDLKESQVECKMTKEQFSIEESRPRGLEQLINDSRPEVLLS